MKYPLVTSSQTISARPPGRSTDVLSSLISVAVFTYVLSVWLFQGLADYSRISIILAFCVMLLVLAQACARGRVLLPRFSLLPWIFVAYVASSLLWAGDEIAAMNSFVSILAAVLGNFALWCATSNGMSWKPVVWGAAVGAVAVTASTLPDVMSYGISGRAAGITGNSNQTAVILCYAALLIWCAPVRLPKWLAWLAILLVVHATVFTGSRKVLICLAAIFLLFGVHIMRDVKRGLLALVLVVIIAGVAFVSSDPDKALDALLSLQVFERTVLAFTGQDPWSYGIRADMFNVAIEMWLERPWLGWGVGQFAARSGFFVYSHNNYTELLANMGVVGLFLYYMFHVNVLCCAYRGFRARVAAGQAAFILVLMVLMLDAAMVSVIGKSSWLLLFFAADLGRISGQPSGSDESFVERIAPRAARQ